MEGLTVRQNQVYEIIKAYWDRVGLSPSMKDVANAIDCTIPNATLIVDKLVIKGYLSRIRSIPRSIKCLK